MSSNCVMTPCVDPCVRKKSESIESEWLSESDFGECYGQSVDSALHPCLVPVYNGQLLDIKPDVIHASLSGISVKHYYGKCCREIDYDEEREEEEGEAYFDGGEGYGLGLYETNYKRPNPKLRKYDYSNSELSINSYSADGEREDEKGDVKYLPVCMRPKINYRNSFWNLHRPELCKLTWPQKYVSTATVLGHLHDHLIFHGKLCKEFHDEGDRLCILNKELSEYGKLKVLASPRNMPPDEKPFDFNQNKNSLHQAQQAQQAQHSKCKGYVIQKQIYYSEARFVEFSDDEDVKEENKSLRRSKEEFCLTIGRHIRKPPQKILVSERGEDHFEPDLHCSVEEESGYYIFDWHQIPAEESYGEGETDESSFDSESLPIPVVDPCPVLAMDDFCRAVAKADFSDLRCNPDDF